AKTLAGDDVGISTDITHGIGLHLGAMFAKDMGLDIAVGDVTVAFRNESSAEAIYDEKGQGDKQDFFGPLNSYVSSEGMQVNLSFQAILDIEAGRTNDPNDTNSINFEGILSEFVNTTLAIDIVDYLHGRYILDVQASINLAQGLSNLYGLQFSAVLSEDLVVDTPTLDKEDGKWVVNGVKTELDATDTTPAISIENGHWCLDGQDSGVSARRKLLSIYYKQGADSGILGVDIQELFGIEPFQLDLNLGDLLGGVFSEVPELSFLAEDGDSTVGTSIQEMLDRISGIVYLYLGGGNSGNGFSASIELTGTVLQSVLRFFGYEKFLPALPQGFTLKNTNQTAAMPDGSYQAFVYDDADELIGSFDFSKQMNEYVYTLNIGNKTINSIEILKNGERRALLGDASSINDYFVISRKDSTIAFNYQGAGTRALDVGSYTVVVTYTDGNTARFDMTKDVLMVSNNPFDLSKVTVGRIQIKADDGSVYKELYDYDRADALGEEWYGDYFAINVKGGLASVGVTIDDSIGAVVQVVVNDTTSATISLNDIVIDFSEKEIEPPTSYRTNVEFLTLKLNVEAQLYLDEDTHIALSNILGDTLQSLLGDTAASLPINITDIPFGLWVGEDNGIDETVDAHYLVSLQMNIHFDRHSSTIIDLGGSDIVLQIYRLDSVSEDKANVEQDLALSVAYIGSATEGLDGKNGALYVNLPYFDLKLKVNEVPLKSLLNNLLADLLNVGTAEADENNNNNTLVLIGQVLNLMAGITLGKQEIDVHFATDLLRQAVALAGLNLDLKDVDGD
ncbi:MAG: hypothetical protein J5755_02015, partial [Clostridia bacterium]|nr:hypothetical protein [Clostridia bacterium]